jgi:hypothetical protein
VTGGFEVDTATLRALGATMTRRGSSLRTTASGTKAKPDAGQSSGEVSGAIATLAGTAGSLADALTGVGSGLEESAASYDRMDQDVHGRFDGMTRGAPR